MLDLATFLHDGFLNLFTGIMPTVQSRTDLFMAFFVVVRAEDSSDDIDPDAVKSSLSELLQNLKESERKKEESLVKVDSLQSAMTHLEEERAALDGKLRDVHQEMNELRDQKRLLEERLNNAETGLTLQVSKKYTVTYVCSAD